MDNKSTENPKRATKTRLKCFNEYIQEKEIANIIEEVTNADMPDVLFKFYSEVHKVKGDNDDETRYASTTLRCIRSGINRYMKEKRSIDIISDPRFIKSNELFIAIHLPQPGKILPRMKN